MFCNHGTQTKIGRALGILLIPRFCLDSTKSLITFLLLVRVNLFLYRLKAYLCDFILCRGAN